MKTNTHSNKKDFKNALSILQKYCKITCIMKYSKISKCAILLILVIMANLNLTKATDYWETCDCYQTNDCDCANDKTIRFKRQGILIFLLLSQ